MRRHVICGCFHAAAWLGATAFVQFAMSSSAARDAYGAINAWWITIYIAILLGSDWRDVAVFVALMSIAMTIDAALGSNLLYHDPPQIGSSEFFAMLLLLSAFWISPFVANSLTVLLKRNLLRQSRLA